MTKNIHPIERVIRVIIGLGILALLLLLEGNAKWWGLIGLAPLATGLIGWCPPYALLGINTCGTPHSENT